MRKYIATEGCYSLKSAAKGQAAIRWPNGRFSSALFYASYIRGSMSKCTQDQIKSYKLRSRQLETGTNSQVSSNPKLRLKASPRRLTSGKKRKVRLASRTFHHQGLPSSLQRSFSTAEADSSARLTEPEYDTATCCNHTTPRSSLYASPC